MKCTGILIHEHKIILRALNVLDAMAKKAQSGELPAKEDVSALLEFLNSFADGLHQGKEESVLFPVFMGACDKSEIDAVRHMVFEHNQERSLVEGMQEALMTKTGLNFAHYARRLVEILRNHIYKEDHILFEMVDKTLTKEEDARVVAGFDSYDRGLGVAYNDLLRRLRELEWKYLGKAA